MIAVSVLSLIILIVGGWSMTIEKLVLRIEDRMEGEEQVACLFQSIAPQLRDEQSLLFVWNDTMQLVLGDGTFIKYFLNANGQVIRQVNGNGGEVIAVGISRLTFTTGGSAHLVHVNVTAKEGGATVGHTLTVDSRERPHS